MRPIRLPWIAMPLTTGAIVSALFVALVVRRNELDHRSVTTAAVGDADHDPAKLRTYVTSESLPAPREVAIADYWRHPLYRVDVWDRAAWDAASEGEAVPLQTVGYYSRRDLQTGFRQLVLWWMPRRESPVVGLTVWDVAAQVWIDPHTGDGRPVGESPRPVWVEAEVKVGLGIY